MSGGIVPEFDFGPRSCTCHPDDNPPVPCPQKFALGECRAAAETRDTEAIMAQIEFYGQNYHARFAPEKRAALRAAVEQIVYECAETRKEWRVQHDRAERAEQEAAALRELLGEAREWIGDSDHDAHCAFDDENDCDCGKFALRARIKAVLEKK